MDPSPKFLLLIPYHRIATIRLLTNELLRLHNFEYYHFYELIRLLHNKLSRLYLGNLNLFVYLFLRNIYLNFTYYQKRIKMTKMRIREI